MILPWHTDLSQPGRTVCVLFRASPLIWPTLFGAHHAPRPLCLRATRCTPTGFFQMGLWARSEVIQDDIQPLYFVIEGLAG